MTKQILAFLFCFKRELNPYDLNEEQKYHVWNAPYTAAVTGEDVADIIDKLRSMYQDAKAKWVWEGDEETGDWVWSETGE